MTPAATRAHGDEVEEANRQSAIEFLTRASSGHAKEAMARYVSTNFVHHNPFFASDADSLAVAMDDNAKRNPHKTLDVQRSISEGALVAVHSRVRLRPENAPVATVHIFRFENGRIAELWDIGQAEPQDAANRSGMF